MLQIKNLNKHYGKKQALFDFEMTFKNGVYGLLGPNGAGKSTLMNIISDNLAPDLGSQLCWNGTDITKLGSKFRRKVGYMPQQQALYDNFTARRFMMYISALKGISTAVAREQTEYLLSEVELHDVMDKAIGGFSGGMKQRVLVAQSLLGSPELVLLDEPTAGLDPNQIIEIRALIKSLGQKHTIILSSHILSEVNAICDYVLIIDKGTLVAEDTPEHLSEDFSDTDNINMSVKGSREQVEEVLKVSEYIRDYKIIDEKDGIVDVQAKTATKEDIRDNLFFEFAEEKLPIIKMERESLSLEDVFLKLTGQDVEEVESEAKKASEQIEKQGHHGFSFKRKKKADSKGTEQAETAEEDK